MKMCIMGWIYEMISNMFVIISPLLNHKFDIKNSYLIDPVSMFVIIPFLYLFNDDHTKEIIFREDWWKGIKYVLGLYTPHQADEHQNRNLPLRD